MSQVPVSENTRVFLNFSLTLEDGHEVDSNYGSAPVSFVIGDGSLLPGFERQMFGMLAGDEGVFTVTPENAFGQPNDNNIQTIKRERFDDDIDLRAGMMFAFADAAGGELPGVVTEFDNNEVTVDFNHPLAGRTILFAVHIDKVEPAELH